MNGELDPRSRSIIRTSIFDCLRQVALNDVYHVSLDQCAHDVFRELVKVDILASQPPANVPFEELQRQHVPQGIVNFITQAFWNLHLQGVLAPSPAWVSKGNSVYNDGYKNISAIITPYGVSLLAKDSDRVLTHDIDGYLNEFYNLTQAPDLEMMRYIGESISVFQSGHHLACVVLLGIASERLLETLAECLRDADDTKGSMWFQDKYEKKRDARIRYKSVSDRLIGKYGSELDEAKLKDAFHGIVTPIFHTIRLARNDIAHPSGREFTWNEVNGFLHSFVQYFKYVDKIMVVVSETT